MRIHYAGKFDGDVSKLPHRKHEKNAVGFKEAETVEGVEKAGLKVVPAILVIETIPLILLQINPTEIEYFSPTCELFILKIDNRRKSYGRNTCKISI